MKYELKILTYNFKNNRTVKDKALVLLRAAFFYALRVILYFKFIRGKINKKIFLSDFFYSEKQLTRIP
jgi:hypothetical protein